jgi:pimeloyl-ACP methyl ester carboxylesterase
MKATTALFLCLLQWRVADGFVQRQQSGDVDVTRTILSSSLQLQSMPLSIASMDDLTFSTPDTSSVQEQACIDAASQMKRIAIPSENSPSGSIGVSYIHWPSAKGIRKANTPPLILLHGFDSSCLEYRRLGPQLAAQGIDAYAVDILGWGFTQLDDVDSFSADAKIETLKGFVKTMFGGDSSFCVAGASLGGAASIELAAALTIDPMDDDDDNIDDDDDAPDDDGMPFCSGLILIDAQGFVDGVGPMAMLPTPLAKIGVGVLKSVPLRNMANQMSYFDTDTFATEDAQVIGRLHTLQDGWSDAMVR